MSTRRLLAGSLVVLTTGAAGLAPPAAAAVSTTSTSLVLSSTRSTYGQTVTAAASVTSTAEPAVGAVYFSVDGVAFRANVAATGNATLVLPAADVGQHTVTATFVPQLPDSQQGSTSSAQAWTVDRVRTRLEVRVTGRGARIPTSVRVRAAGEYGSRPTGRVRVVLKRAGTRGTTVDSQVLAPDGGVETRLGTLPRGRYRVTVTYAGDGRHLRERRVQWFRVVKR
ncbi:Ig-like domain-containing protein [Nocardioides hwasunensis]|uniref:Ig-like domain repeat protein n=1 Tax=Nocardioides hwasunensis TaxID=397258 RepID=A0ABR8MJ58_9ACTN|nr:Ig-like domain-containing protein [Nocardioides hwasunensis]MBD3916089.1 Ig-like domain repeat protein [Nocardioides hwasunensis]